MFDSQCMATRETVAAAVTRLAGPECLPSTPVPRVIIRSCARRPREGTKDGEASTLHALMQVWEIGPRRALPEVLPTFDMHRRSW